jgi:hypothetical protein
VIFLRALFLIDHPPVLQRVIVQPSFLHEQPNLIAGDAATEQLLR